MSALYPLHYNHIELNNSHLSYTWFTGVRKDVDFESGKVLLSNIGGKIHATSAFCSHYGAPLSSNVHSCPKHLASLTMFIPQRVFLSLPVASHGTSCHLAPQHIKLTIISSLDHSFPCPIPLMGLMAGDSLIAARSLFAQSVAWRVLQRLHW